MLRSNFQLGRRSKRVVQRLLGEVKVAEQPDQGGEDAARLGAIDGVHHLAHSFGRVVAHCSQALMVDGSERQMPGIPDFRKNPLG